MGCSFPGCAGKLFRFGLCSTHNKQRLRGEALHRAGKNGPAPTPLEKRFWAKVNKDGPVIRPGLGSCWLWTGGRTVKGYGNVMRCRMGRSGMIGDGAHRVSWEIANGRRVPDGLHVLHACDNPPCVNPAHLSIGTRSDNMLDCVKKGRWGTKRVPPTPGSKSQRRVLARLERSRASQATLHGE